MDEAEEQNPSLARHHPCGTRARRKEFPGLFHPPFRGYRLCRIKYGCNAIATDIAAIALRPYIDVAFEAIL